MSPMNRLQLRKRPRGELVRGRNKPRQDGIRVLRRKSRSAPQVQADQITIVGGGASSYRLTSRSADWLRISVHSVSARGSVPDVRAVDLPHKIRQRQLPPALGGLRGSLLVPDWQEHHADYRKHEQDYRETATFHGLTLSYHELDPLALVIPLRTRHPT